MSKDANDKLWDYLIQQDSYIFQEFSTGIIGIGALFFAYAVAPYYAYLKDIIAVVALGGSFVLWIHVYASWKDGDSIRSKLKRLDPDNQYFETRKWRDRWPYTSFYPSSSRLATYFMGLVTLGWFLILVHLISPLWPSLKGLAFLSIEAMVIAIGLFIYRMKPWRKQKKRCQSG